MRKDELTRDLDVLIVDDDAAVRELLLEYFTALGFRVTEAQDGRGAIGILQRSWGRFGLVVTDLNLPGADGFAVLQAARQANVNCYVVIITGFASLDSAIRAVRVGAYDYLTKPFSLGQLDVMLTRIRERRSEETGRPVPPKPHAPPPLPVRGGGSPAPSLPAGHSSPVPATARAIDGVQAVSSYDLAQRLGLLEEAFGRIEALLREKR